MQISVHMISNSSIHFSPLFYCATLGLGIFFRLVFVYCMLQCRSEGDSYCWSGKISHIKLFWLLFSYNIINHPRNILDIF
uniref:Uncharacterized protein n=1 Tax=Populus trichocarpa TaxID=3694 RepID=A0A2K1WWA2_POPTR